MKNSNFVFPSSFLTRLERRKNKKNLREWHRDFPSPSEFPEDKDLCAVIQRKLSQVLKLLSEEIRISGYYYTDQEQACTKKLLDPKFLYHVLLSYFGQKAVKIFEFVLSVGFKLEQEFVEGLLSLEEVYPMLLPQYAKLQKNVESVIERYKVQRESGDDW